MDIMMRLKGAGFSVIANEFRQRERRLGTGLPLQDFIEIVLQGLPKTKTSEEKYANVNALVDLFEDMDINGDGTMEFDEFTSFCVDAGMVATRTKTASLKHRYVRNAKHVIKTMSGAVGVDKVRWCPLFKRFFVLENAAKSVKIFSADGYMVGEVVSQSTLLNNAPPVGSEVSPNSSSSEEKNRSNDRDGSPRKGGSVPDKESVGPGSSSSRSQSAASGAAATTGASNAGIFILDAAFLYKFQCLAVSTTDFVISFYNMEEPKHQQRLRASTLMASGKSGPDYELIPKLTITTTTAQLLLRFCEQSGVLVSAGNDFIVNVWKIVDLENKVLWKRLVHHQDMIMDVVEIPLHDMIASCDLNHTIQLWDIHDCRSRGALIGHVRGIRQMVFSKDHDMLLTAGFEFEAYGWDIASRQVVMKLVGHRAPLIGVQLALFQTERAITGDSSGVFKVWDISRAIGGGLHTSSTGGGGQGSRQGGRSASHAVLLESLDPTHQLSRFEPTAFMCLHPNSRDVWATASGSSTLHLFRSTRVQQFDEIPLKAFYHHSANRFIVVSGAVCSVWDGETGACLDEFADVGAGVGSNTTGSHPPTDQASSNHNGSTSSSHGQSSTDILLCVQDANCKKLVVLAEDGEMGVFNSQNFVQMRRCEEKFRSVPLAFAYRNQSSGLPPPSCGIVGLHYCSENKLVIATDSHTSSILVIDDGNNESAKGIKETSVLRRLVHVPGGIAASAYSYHASMIATLDQETNNKVSLWDFETLSYVAVCQLEDDEREPDTTLNMLAFWNEFPVLLASDLRGSLYFFAAMPTVYAKTGKLLHAFINDHTITAATDSIAESGGDGEEACDAAGGTTFITEPAGSAAARKFLLKRKSLLKATAKCAVSGASDSASKKQAVQGGVVTSMHIIIDDDSEQHRYLLFTGDEKGVVRVWDLSQMMRRLSLFKIPESSCKYLRRGYHPRAMFAHDCVKDATMKHANANGSESSTTGLLQSVSSGELLRDPRVLPSQSQLKKLTKQRADAKKKSSVLVTTQLGKLLPPNRVQAGQAPPAATTVAAAEAFLVAKPASKRGSSIMDRKESSAASSQIQLSVGDGSLVHARARAAGSRRRSYCLEHHDVSIVSVWSAHTDGITSLEVSKHPNVVVTCGLDMRVFVWNWQGMCLGKLFDAENIGPCRWRFQKDDTKRQEERRVLISELMQELEMQPHQKANRRRETLYQQHMKHKSHSDLPHVNVILLDHIVSKHPEIAAMEKDGLSSASTDERINAEMEKLHQRNYRAKMSMLQTLEQASAAPGASIKSKEIVRIHSLAQVGPLLCVDKFETKDELQQMKFAEKEELTMDRQYLQTELAIGADSSPLAQRVSLKAGSLATIKSQIRTAQQQAEEMLETKVALQRHAMAMYSNLRMVQRRSSASGVRKASVDVHENMLLTKQTGIAASADKTTGDVSKYQQQINELLEPSALLRRSFSEQTLSLRPQTAPSPTPKRSVARVSTSGDVLKAGGPAARSGDKNPRVLRPLISSASEASLLNDSSSTPLPVHPRSTSLANATAIHRRSSLDQLYIDELRRQQQSSPKKSRRPSEAVSVDAENVSMETSPTFNKLDSINSIIDRAQAMVDSTPGVSTEDNDNATDTQPTFSQEQRSTPQVLDRGKRGKPVGLPTLRETEDAIPEELESESVRINESVLRGHLEVTRLRMEEAMRDNERFCEGGQSHRSLINKQRHSVEQMKKGKRMEDYIQQKRREMNNNIGAVFKRTSFAFPAGGGLDTEGDEKRILKLPGKKGAKAGAAVSTQASENHRAAHAAQAEVEKSKVFGIYSVKEVMSVIRLFWSMDEDGSGALSLAELLAYKSYFEKLGYHDMTTVFQAIDKDGSGNVTLKELLEICFQYATKYQVEEMLKLAKLGDVASYFDASRSKRGGPFMKADHNKGEQSDASSAKETLTAEERAELMAIFRVFDRNGDGGVSMEEIVEALHVEDDDAMARVAAAEEAQLASRDAASGGRRRASVSMNAPPPVQTSKSGFTKDEVRKIYQDFDKDGSESLEFDEFVALMQALYGPRH